MRIYEIERYNAGNNLLILVGRHETLVDTVVDMVKQGITSKDSGDKMIMQAIINFNKVLKEELERITGRIFPQYIGHAFSDTDNLLVIFPIATETGYFMRYDARINKFYLEKAVPRAN